MQQEGEISEIDGCIWPEMVHQNVEKDILPVLKVEKLYYGKEQLQYKLISQDCHIRLRPEASGTLQKEAVDSDTNHRWVKN